MNAVIELEEVSKRFACAPLRTSLIKRLAGEAQRGIERHILESVSFKVYPGECVGIIGPNGAGKSTLLRIIAGILKPSSGVLRKKGTVLPLFCSDVGFTEELEIRDNIMLYGALIGIPLSKIRSAVEQTLAVAGLTNRADDPIRLLSPGMRARLAFAIAAQSHSELILIDELTVFGDTAFRFWVKNQMQKWRTERRAVLHVTHDLSTIEALSSRILHLENGRIAAPLLTTLKDATYGAYQAIPLAVENLPNEIEPAKVFSNKQRTD